MKNEAAALHWLRLARYVMPIALCGLLAIGIFSAIADLLQNRGLSVFFFLQQDLPVITAISLILRFGLKPDVQIMQQVPWMAAIARYPWVMALIIFIVCWAGHRLLLLGYDLTRDEQMANFDSLIFSEGRLFQPIEPIWRPMAEALNQFFILPITDRQSWVSSYLPVNAAVRAVFLQIGDASLTGPLFTAVGALALWSITVRLWPEDPTARAVAILLYAGSSQVVVIGMTAYAMSGHLALNLVWLALFLRGRWSHVGAIIVGFLATGMHQPIFHPLFILPFIVGLLRQKRWLLAVFYGAAYLTIGLFWLTWPHLIAQSAGGAMQTLSVTGERFGYIERAIGLLQEFGPINAYLMVMNVLRFIAWQHLLLLPLAAAGTILAWRAPLVRSLAIGILLTLLVVGVLLAYQGHGWGYRYLHGMIGSTCLLGGYGWRALRGLWPKRRLWAWTNAANFILFMPLHCLMAANFTAPYAHASAAIGHVAAMIVVIDEGAVAFADDLVLNRPDLSNRPVRLRAGSLTIEQAKGLCAIQTVAFIGRPDLEEIAGIIPSQAGDDAHFNALKQVCAAVRLQTYQ